MNHNHKGTDILAQFRRKDSTLNQVHGDLNKITRDEISSCLQEGGDANTNHTVVSIRSIVLTTDNSEYAHSLQYNNVHQVEVLASHHEDRELKSRCMEKTTADVVKMLDLREQIQHSASLALEQNQTIAKLNSVIVGLNMTIGEHEVMISHLREGLQRSASRFSELDCFLEEQLNDITQLKKNYGEVDFRLKQYDAEIEQKDSKITNLESTNEELIIRVSDQQIRIVEFEKKELFLKQSLEEYSNSSVEMCNIIASLDIEIKNSRRRSHLEFEEATTTFQEDLSESELRYRNLCNELMELRTENALLKRKLEECESSLNSVTSSNTAKSVEILQIAYDEACEKLKVLSLCEKNLLYAQHRLGVTEQTLATTVEKQEETEKKLVVMSSTLESTVSKDHFEAVQQELDQANQALADTTSRMSEYRQKYAVASRELEQVRTQLKDVKDVLCVAQTALDTRVPRDRFIEALDNIEELSSQLRGAREQLAKAELELEKCKAEIKDYNTQLATAYAQIEDLKMVSQEHKYITDLEEYKERIDQLTSQYEKDLSSAREELQEVIKSTSRELDSQKESFRSLEINYQRTINELNDSITAKESLLLQQLVELDSVASDRLRLVRTDYEAQLSLLRNRIVELERLQG